MPKHKPIKFKETLEPNLKKYIKRIIKENPNAKSIRNATLGLIAVGSILTFGPTAVIALAGIGKILHGHKRESYKHYRKIWHSFRKLKQYRTVRFVKEEDGYLIYEFTDQGKKEVKKLIFDELKIKKPKKWDGKWRLVIFDIPEKISKARVALRKKLKDMGFYQCQKSAWIHPFQCTKEIEFIKDILSIKSYVRIFILEDMDDGRVLYHFRNLIKNTIVK